jgi:Flp pilus assembly protein TadD
MPSKRWTGQLPCNLRIGGHYVARGKIWKDMKIYAKALADFRKAIELHPDNAGSNMKENIILTSLNSEAETCAKHEAEVLDPVALWEEGKMHYQRAVKDGYAGEFKEALKDFNRAIILKPDFAQAWASKGALYQGMGELDKAITAYSRTIELVPAAGQLPTEGQYYFGRSSVRYELGDHAKALEDILQTLALNPKKGNFYSGLGFICEQLGDKSKAIVAFQKAVEFGYEKAREQLDRLEADSGDDEDDGDSDDNEYTPAEDFNYGVPEDRDGVQIYGPKDRNIRSVNIPLDIDGMAVLEIGDGAFKDCASLVKITIPASVDYIGQEAFQSCTSLSVVNMGECLRYLGSRAFKNCSSLTEIDIPSTIEDIRGNVFDGCISLRTIRIHGGLDSVNVDEDTLSGCVTVHQDNHEKDYNLGMQQ